MIVCPSCGQENPDGFRLCGMCGTSLVDESMPEREERKVVTVAFCDLVGFTARAERLDPEEVRAVLRPYHERVRHELERHGGTVEKFIGDAVMALFGAPTAHEDDPERAVRAALAIRDFALQQELELRVGITTGEALVALRARPDAGEGMASGDVVNTAARLQSAAPVNGILVDETTYRATRRVIDFENAEPVEAKGKAEPVPVWLATCARSRFGVDVTHHARTELVGRERELGILRDAFERARHERIPQLVTLVGVPGIGKSRLVYELSRLAEDDPELITWRQGRCLAYGDGVAFWALGEVVKAQAGIVERDAPEDVAEKLRRAVDAVLADTRDARWVETHLRPLVGLGTDAGLGGDRHAEAFAAWRRFLEALAELRPLVLVVEDLHWADDGLLDFLDELVDWVSGVPLLIVCSARPELLERRPGWGGGKLNATTLALSALSSDETAQLLARLLEQTLLPADTQQALLERAGGNPLYAEQFAQLYLERGSADELSLPETLQGIVAARVDGLSSDEKALLHDAAVVGKVFWTGALGRNDHSTVSLLHGLERKGFLTRQRRSSVDDESEWSFAHMLLRDVAYGQIARAERAAKHRRVAEWIESLGRPDDHAELLAHHWRSALELTRASGGDVADLVDSTRRALRDAGDRAYSVCAYPAAAAYYDGALALSPADDDERPLLLYRRADALYIADDERALSSLEEARDALLAAGDRETAAEAEIALSRVWWHRGLRDRSTEHERRAGELVAGTSSPAAARVLASVARTRSIAGDHDNGLALAKKALELADTMEIDEVRAHALTTIGLVKGQLGDPEEGARLIGRALDIAIDTRSSQIGAIANNLAVQAILSANFAHALQLFEEGYRLAESVGDVTGARWLERQLAIGFVFLGRWDEGLRALDAFIAESESGSPHYLEPIMRAQRGRIRVARGDLVGGLDDHRRAVEVARGAGDPQALLQALSAAVGTLEIAELDDECRTYANELVRRALESRHEAPYFLPLDFSFARVALDFEPQLREIVEVTSSLRWRELMQACLERDFVRAAQIWEEGGSPMYVARLSLRAAEELIESGRLAEGVEQARRAIDFCRDLRATYFLERAEALIAQEATG